MNDPTLLAAAGFPPPAQRERRVAVRFRCSATTPCPVTTDDQPQGLAARVRDVSVVGVGLLLSCRVVPGALLTLTPERSNGGASCALPARIVHATRRDGNDWLVGCVFTRPLSDAELEAMLAY
jgi:hypothetical protein